MEKYDVAIIGAGPAGLSSALYSSRAMLSTIVFEKNVVGGLITQTTEIENYPGSEDNSTGFSLTQQMFNQAQSAGSKFAYEEVIEISRSAENQISLKTNMDNTYEAKALIYAAGTVPRLLGIKGEMEYRGRGVSYCATCDAGFFRNKRVALVGGGDTAIKEAEYLTKFASEVVVFHRRNELRASKILAKKIEENEKIKIIYNTVLSEIGGNDFVEYVMTENTVDKHSEKMYFDGVFIFAGYTPNVKILEDIVETDKNGYIITDKAMHTSAAGIFAAGDISDTPLRQVITAASDGATAAVEAEKYISEQE